MRQKRKPDYFYFTKLRRIGQGMVLTILAVVGIAVVNRETFPGEFLLTETIPGYKPVQDTHYLFKFDTGLRFAEGEDAQEAYPVFSPEDAGVLTNMEDVYGDDFTPDRIENQLVHNTGQLVGIHDGIFQPEPDNSNIEKHFSEINITMADVEKLRDLDYFKSQFYIVNQNTEMTGSLFDVDRFLQTDLSLSNQSGPKVLIFHTHSTEKYADSNDITEGVLGVGERLAQVLESKYGIKSIHYRDSFDLVDGVSAIQGAYERMEPAIQKVLAENPSIEICIDIHRDGVGEDVRLVTDIDGKQTAQIMFVNGLTAILREGTLTPIDSLPNPYLDTNLAFSFHMQMAANSMYPGFTRKVYLHAYRYSLHMKPKSLLVEVGAQTNTKEEAFNAVEPLADLLAQVVN